MSQIRIAGIGGTPRFLTKNGTKVWLGANYNGGWRGAQKSLSFNMGSGAALPRLNVMEGGVRYEPVGPDTSPSLSYPECFQQGYCDAAGHIAALPPGATAIYLHFQSFDKVGFDVHFGTYRMEWDGPDWSATLGVNVAGQGTLPDGTKWADIIVEAADGNDNPRFYWPDPASEGDYPRIRRIVRTDRLALHDAGERWNPDFLDEILDAGGNPIMTHLRFMDAMGTNNSTVERLSDFPPLSSPRLSPWPPEVYTDLCNRLGVDCWICIPHRMVLEHAPSYVPRGSATFTGNILTEEAVALVQRVDALLNTDLKIYIEYSNEYWNSAFDQFHETWSAASAAGWNTSSNFHPSYFGAKVQTRLFQAIKGAFGDRAASRLVCVCASQAAGQAVTDRLIKGERWLEEDGPPAWVSPASVCDAVAIAPYLGSKWIETSGEVQSLITRIDAGDTQEQINAYMIGRLQALNLDTQPIDWINTQADLADQYDLPLIAYEGGTHVLHFFSIEGVTDDDVEKIAPYLIEFSYSLEHWSLQEPILEAWKTRAGGPFDMFSLFYRPNKFGAWGHERALGVDTPGELAKEAWQEANPRWWKDWRDYGLAVPAPRP